MPALYKRSLVSIALAVLVTLVLFAPPLLGTWVVVAIVGIALDEFYQMVEKKGIIIPKKFGIVLGCLIPFGVHLTSAFKIFPATWEIVFTILVCFIIFGVQFTRRQSIQAIAVLSTTVFGVLYISWPLSFFIKFLYMASGRGLILYLLLVTKLGDIGAYLVGMKFGRHTLIKRISPNKSKEGTIGGLVFSTVASFLAGGIWLGIRPAEAIILGVILGGLAQLGDLCESLLKRDCRVKDSGSIFPGLGGMLDLVDSIIFAAPFFYLYVSFFLK